MGEIHIFCPIPLKGYKNKCRRLGKKHQNGILEGEKVSIQSKAGVEKTCQLQECTDAASEHTKAAAHRRCKRKAAELTDAASIAEAANEMFAAVANLAAKVDQAAEVDQPAGAAGTA